MHLGFVEIFIIVIVLLYLGFNVKEHFSEVEYVVSTVDKRKYLVRNLPDSLEAANLLAKLNIRMTKLINHLSEKYPDDKDIKQLKKNYRPDSISEGKDDANYTSYSINKGEQIVFCIRSRDANNKLEDINTLMFVATHELAHLMTSSVGHTPQFWENFRRILEEAVTLGLYTKVDYSKEPQSYCGIKITSTVLKDEKST